MSVCPADTAVDALPSNLGKSLRQLIVWHRAQPRDLPAIKRRVRLDQALPGRRARLQLNEDTTRTVVDVRLDGSVPSAMVRDALTGLDGRWIDLGKMQIVHDLAPGAGLMFHAAGGTPETGGGDHEFAFTDRPRLRRDRGRFHVPGGTFSPMDPPR